MLIKIKNHFINHASGYFNAAVMKRILIYAIMAAAAVWVYANRAELNTSPFEKRYPFVSPYWAVADAKGDMYMVDGQSRRITKITRSGEVLWHMTGPGGGAAGEVYWVYDMALDKNGALNVFYQRRFTGGSDITYEIDRFTPDGAFAGRTVVDSAAEFIGGFVLTPEPLKEFMYFLYQRDEAVGMVIKRYDPASGKIDDAGGAPIDYNKLEMVARDNSGKYYFVNMDGGIFSFYPGGGTAEVVAAPGSVPFPSQFWCGRGGELFVKSHEDRNILKFTPPSLKIEKFITDDELKRAAGAEDYYLKWLTVSPSGEVIVVEFRSGALLAIGPDGKLSASIKEGTISAALYYRHVAVWAVFAALAAAAVFLVLQFYYGVFARKKSIIIQNIAIFIPLLAFSILLTARSIYNNVFPLYEKEIENRFLSNAYIASLSVSGDAVEKLNKKSDFDGPEYKKIYNSLRAVINENGDPWNENMTARVFRKKNGMICVVCDSEMSSAIMRPYPYAVSEHFRAAESGEVLIARGYSSSSTNYLAAVAPLRNSAGSITGILELSVHYSTIREFNDIFVGRLLREIFIYAVAYMCLLVAISYFMLLAIRMLRNIVRKITSGNFEVSYDHSREDELGDLGRGIDSMARSIREYISNIMELNASYFRFVPKNFIELLDRDSVTKIKLGDNIRREMAVMFSDIRSFSSMSEKMTPQENFDFINSFLKKIGPVIRENSGFIDKYIGDAIMALFETPDASLKCAGAMIERLAEYNGQRRSEGKEPVSIGIGIHFGELMLGIVGEEERVNATVISDSVNLASRLEGLCKYFGALVVISGDLIEKSSNAADFSIRPLGRVMVKGKKGVVSVHELIVAGADDNSRKKAETAADFKAALAAYEKAEMEKARAAFAKICEYNPGDAAARVYLDKCAKFIESGVPENFDGVEEMSEK